MQISLEELTKDSPELAELAIGDATELKKRVSLIEEKYFRREGKKLGILEFANMVCYTRWPNGDNLGTFIQLPDYHLLEDAYRFGVYDTPRTFDEENIKNTGLQEGLNNSYISWPSVLTFFAGINSSLKRTRKTGHLRMVEIGIKNYPGINLDIDRDEYINNLSNMAGVGNAYKQSIKEGMLFSIIGELIQNNVGISELPEMRGNLMGVQIGEKILNKEGMEALQKMTPVEFTEYGIEQLDSVGKELKENRLLKRYFHHFEEQAQTSSGKLMLNVLEKYIALNERFPALSKIEYFNYIYRNIRASTKGYDEMIFGKYPAPLPDWFHPRILQSFPELITMGSRIE